MQRCPRRRALCTSLLSHTLVALVAAAADAAAQPPSRPYALQAALQFGVGAVLPASPSESPSYSMGLEGSLARRALGLFARLDGVTYPRVCSVLALSSCTYPSDVGVGLILGVTAANARTNKPAPRASAGFGAFRWSDGTIDPTAALQLALDLWTSPPIGLRFAAGWRTTWADETVSVASASVGLLARVW